MTLCAAIWPLLLVVAYGLASLSCATHRWLTIGRMEFIEKGLPIGYVLGDWAPRRLRILIALRKMALLATIALVTSLPLAGESVLLHRL